MRAPIERLEYTSRTEFLHTVSSPTVSAVARGADGTDEVDGRVVVDEKRRESTGRAAREGKELFDLDRVGKVLRRCHLGAESNLDANALAPTRLRPFGIAQVIDKMTVSCLQFAHSPRQSIQFDQCHRVV
jgi:hypothetical protein